MQTNNFFSAIENNTSFYSNGSDKENAVPFYKEKIVNVIGDNCLEIDIRRGDSNISSQNFIENDLFMDNKIQEKILFKENRGEKIFEEDKILKNNEFQIKKGLFKKKKYLQYIMPFEIKINEKTKFKKTKNL